VLLTILLVACFSVQRNPFVETFITLSEQAENLVHSEPTVVKYELQNSERHLLETNLYHERENNIIFKLYPYLRYCLPYYNFYFIYERVSK
jgi:uncharacterized protein YcfL